MDILEHIEYFIVIVTASQLNCRHCYSVVYHQAISWNLFSKISGKFKHINFFFLNDFYIYKFFARVVRCK